MLTSGCDLPGVPLDLADRLGDGPAVARDQPLLGVWPVVFAATVDTYLQSPGNRSVYGLVAHCGARLVDIGFIANINTLADLAASNEQTA